MGKTLFTVCSKQMRIFAGKSLTFRLARVEFGLLDIEPPKGGHQRMGVSAPIGHSCRCRLANTVRVESG